MNMVNIIKENELERKLFSGSPNLNQLTESTRILDTSFIISGVSTDSELKTANKNYEKLANRFQKYLGKISEMTGYELNSQQEQLALNEYVGLGKFSTYTKGDSKDDFGATRLDVAVKNALSYNPFKTVSRCVGTSGLNLFLGDNKNISLLTNDEHMFLKLDGEKTSYTIETAGSKDNKQVLPLSESLIENNGFTEWPSEYYPLFLLINRAYGKNEKGEFKGATEDLNKALSLDPKFYPAYFALGEFQTKKGNYKKAKEYFEEGLKFQPKQVTNNKNQNPNAVMHYFSEVLYNNRGVVKTREGDYPAAITDYNKAAEINPKSPVIFSNRGDTKEKMGDFRGAYLDYTKAIILNRDVYEEKNNPELFEKRSSLALKLGKPRKAMDDANNAITILQSSNAKTYFVRGKAREQLGFYSLAIDDYAKSAEIKDDEFKLVSQYRTQASKNKKAYRDFVRKIGREKAKEVKTVQISTEIEKTIPDEDDIFTEFGF